MRPAALIVLAVLFVGCERAVEEEAKSEAIPPRATVEPQKERATVHRGVTILPVPNEQDDDLLFTLFGQEPGKLRVEHAGAALETAIGVVPARFDIRVRREAIDGESVLDQYLGALLGRTAVDRLRAEYPEADSGRLFRTKIDLRNTEQGIRYTMGPIITSASAGGHSQARVLSNESRAHGDREVRLASWLYLPDGFEGSVQSRGLDDSIRVIVDGVELTPQEAGAKHERLTLSFRPDGDR